MFIFSFGALLLGFILRGASFIFYLYLAISDAERQLELLETPSSSTSDTTFDFFMEPRARQRHGVAPKNTSRKDLAPRTHKSRGTRPDVGL
jgi:hypothetical protein